MKRKAGNGTGRGERPPKKARRQRSVYARKSGGSGGRIALVIVVVGLVLIVLFIVPRGQQTVEEPLPRTGFVTGTPINNVDPTSGKPIVAGITSTYKGYTIGHCCAVSKGDFERLLPSQKDAAILRFLK